MANADLFCTKWPLLFTVIIDLLKGSIKNATKMSRNSIVGNCQQRMKMCVCIKFSIFLLTLKLNISSWISYMCLRPGHTLAYSQHIWLRMSFNGYQNSFVKEGDFNASNFAIVARIMGLLFEDLFMVLEHDLGHLETPSNRM